MGLIGGGASFDYKAATTIAIAINIISYFLTLIARSQAEFTYGVRSSTGVLNFFATLYGSILSFIGSISGMPEWFNALFTIPVSVIIIMYTINKM